MVLNQMKKLSTPMVNFGIQVALYVRNVSEYFQKEFFTNLKAGNIANEISKCCLLLAVANVVNL